MTGVILCGLILPLLAWLLDQQYNISSHILRCLIDNFGHGLIAAVIWAPNSGIGSPIFVSGIFGKYEFLRRYSQGLEVVLSFVSACGLDIDHFIAGGALTLKAATTLSSRPFGHSLIFIVVISSLLGYLTSSSRLGLLVFVSTLSHQLRDSTRRGIWFWPFGHTPPVPYVLYLALLAALPFIVHFLLDKSKGDGASLCNQRDLSSEQRILHIV